MTIGHSPLAISQRIALHAGGMAVLLLTLAGGYLLGIRPIYLRAAESAAEQRRLEVVIASADSIDDSISSLRVQIAATETELRRALDHLPEQPHMDELMARISDAARVSTAEVLSLQPTSTQKGETAAIQTIRLRLRCDHAALCRFLSTLASGSGAIWVAAAEVKSEPLRAPGVGGGIRYAELILRVPHAAEKTLAGNLKRTLVPAPGA